MDEGEREGKVPTPPFPSPSPSSFFVTDYGDAFSAGYSTSTFSESTFQSLEFWIGLNRMNRTEPDCSDVSTQRQKYARREVTSPERRQVNYHRYTKIHNRYITFIVK